MTPTRFPLYWPVGWKRAMSQADGKFSRYGKDLSVFDGVQRVLGELERMGIGESDVVVSTNVETRLDGLPRSDRLAPGDPGVAVYWQPRKGPMRCMAIDRYKKVADNLAAIAATLDAMRAIERHGGATILDRAFAGFAALPAPNSTDWWSVLRVEAHAPTSEVTHAWKYERSLAHPDRKETGSASRFDAVNKAYEAFKQERGL